jgi:uncharacterized protein
MDNLRVPSDVTVTNDNYMDILNTPSVSSSEKIYDFADLYSESEELELYNSVSEYIKNTKIDVGIVTTRNLSGFSISDYAYNFYDYNDFSEEGVIFIIYVGGDEDEIFMGNSGKTNGDVFSIYSDSRINAILSYTYKDIESGNYYTATSNYIKIIDGFYTKDRGSNYKVDSNGNIIKTIPWIEVLILSITLTFIIVFIFICKLKNNSKDSLNSILDKKLDTSTLIIKTNSDNLVDTIVSNVK